MTSHQQRIAALQRHLKALPAEQEQVDVKILAELFDLTIFVARRVVLFSGRRPTEENEEFFAKAEDVTVKVT